MSVLLFCFFCTIFLSFFPPPKFLLQPEISRLTPLATDSMERLEHNPVVIHSSLSGASLQIVAQRHFCFFFSFLLLFLAYLFFRLLPSQAPAHVCGGGFFIVIPPFHHHHHQSLFVYHSLL